MLIKRLRLEEVSRAELSGCLCISEVGIRADTSALVG